MGRLLGKIMKKSTHHVWLPLLVFCVGCVSSIAALAQAAAYPVNRVTLVTHSSPGGGTDVFLRDLIKQMNGVLKTSMSVENIRGGSGATAVSNVAKGAPDGSIFYGTTPTYIQTTLLSKPPVGYDGLDPMLIVFLDLISNLIICIIAQTNF